MLCICDLLEYVVVGLKITLLKLHPYFPMLPIHAQSLDSHIFPSAPVGFGEIAVGVLSVCGKGAVCEGNEK